MPISRVRKLSLLEFKQLMALVEQLTHDNDRVHPTSD